MSVSAESPSTAADTAALNRANRVPEERLTSG